MKLNYLLSLLFAGSLVIVSCGKKDVSKSGAGSSTTGWDYNSADNGGFEVVTEYEPSEGPGLVFIEGGTFTMGRVEQDLNYDWNSVPRRLTVSSFYMDETEVRNVDYREYLFWIARVFAEYPAVYKKALPDTLVWRSKLAYNEPYVEYYFRHPAYNEYPVVGVSWIQASDYCAWRSDRVNEKILVDNGFLKMDPQQAGAENFNTDAYLAGQYEGLVDQNKTTPMGVERKVRLEDGLLLPKYRLPTEAEWEFAAFSLIGNSFDERIYERRLYPWNGHTLRNDESKVRGQMRANYVRGRGDYMGTAGDLNDNAEITAPVKSYWPNDYGLYCMAGNVNEWVLDVYRPMSLEDMDEFRPFRGNVFQEAVRDEEGNIAAKDSLGRIRYQDVTPEHTAGRRNYTKSDYRNFNDGDLDSSVDYSVADSDKEKSGSTRMYANNGKNDISSLISDNVRVYKGGSWKDRAYWLSPGTRRYLDENASKDDLGFRCAMTRVGSPKGF